MNTPGQPNGVHRTWLDGELAADITLSYRTVSRLKITKLTFSTFFGGKWAAEKDERLLFDNFVVSKRPISH